jgi:competence protein ComEC
VIRRWSLPAGAAGMWAGMLLTGRETGNALGWGLLLSGIVGVIAVARWGSRIRARSRRLVGGAGLEVAVPLASPRERVLAAAGLPVGREEAATTMVPAARRISAAVAACGLIGAGWVGVREALRPDLGPLQGRAVRIRGTAVSDLRRSDWGWSVEVGVDHVAVAGKWIDVDLRVWAAGSDRPASIQAGQPVSGHVVLDALDPAASGFDAYLAGRGVVARASVSELAARGPPENPWLRMAASARDALRRGAGIALPDREAALLLGLSIGDTSRIDAEVEEDFRASGLAHLVAVSGANVAMFLAPVLAVATRLRMRLTALVALGVVAVAFFALLTRWEPSVLRAGVMAAVALGGLWAGRPRSTGALLGTSIVVLLVADPGLAGSVGFQLSVAATVGLALLAGPLANRLRAFPRPVALAAAATAAAQIGVTPLLLLHFGVVPTVTLLANVAAFPAVAAALIGGLVASGAALVWPPVGAGLGGPAAAPLTYLIELADRMARLPLPSVTGEGPAAAVAAAFLALLVAWRLRRTRRSRASQAVAAAVLAALTWSAAGLGEASGTVTVTFLDVGQGDAAVVRGPDEATILIDAGPEPDQVAAELAALGVRRIDLAVASHGHADHVEGFPAVLARHPVGLLLEPGCPVDSPSYRRFLDSVRNEEVPARRPRGGGAMRVGDLLLQILGPDECSPDEPNDDSLVVRIVLQGVPLVLFPGDVEVPAQQDLLEDGDPISAAVLKVPHHGGDTSDPGFLRAVDAAVAVVSTGLNDYGHPHAAVLATLEAEGMAVYRTDRSGDVTVRFGPDGVLVETA